jgi:hypothetical protein
VPAHGFYENAAGHGGHCMEPLRRHRQWVVQLGNDVVEGTVDVAVSLHGGPAELRRISDSIRTQGATGCT